MFFLRKMIACLSAASQSMSIARRQVGVAIVRIVFGSVTAVLYGFHFSQRHFLWGSDAVVTPADTATILSATHAWTLYSFFPSALGAACLYWFGFVVSLMFAAGLFVRITPLLFFVFTWSIYQRNSYALDGGDNLLVILAIYLIFADLSAFSLDRYLFGPPRPHSFSWLSGMLHNFAVTACLLQLAILYFDSAFYKIQGHVWSSGTAVYYILRSNGFALPGWGDFIWQSAALVTIGTYGTILFEIIHPFLMWHPRLKYLIFAGAVVLHASIGILMGLVWFSLTMIGAHAILFDDAEYLRLYGFLRVVCGNIARAVRRPIALRPRSFEAGNGAAEPSSAA
jgi:hypothetical protein